MQILAFGVYACMLVFSVLIYRKFSNPFVLFNFIWMFLIGVSCIGYFGIETTSDQVYRTFLIGGVACNLLGLLLSFVRGVLFQRVPTFKRKIFLNDRFKKRLMLFLQLVIAVYYVVKGVMLVRYLLSGGAYSEVRKRYFSAEYLSSNAEYLALVYIIDPIVLVTEIVFSLNMVKRQYSVFSLLVMLFNIVMRAAVSGGRMILFELVLLVIFSLLLNKQNRTWLSSGVKALLVVGAGAVGAVNITAGRTGNRNIGFFATIAETIAVNFTGSFKYYSILDQWSRFASSSNGRSVLAGLFDPFISLGRFLGLTDAVTAQNEIGNLLADFYTIGDYSFNAMPTMYYFFQTDFGNAGPVFAGICLALILFFAYRNHRTQGTEKSFAYYLLALLVLLESPMIWLPFRSSFVMAVFYTALLVSNQSLASPSGTNSDFAREEQV